MKARGEKDNKLRLLQIVLLHQKEMAETTATLHLLGKIYSQIKVC